MSRGLSEADRQSFFRLNISEDVLRRARLVRASGAEAREKFGIHDCGPCIVFPYFPAPNGIGDSRPLTFRARQDAGRCRQG
jgi:hypothetical protein